VIYLLYEIQAPHLLFRLQSFAENLGGKRTPSARNSLVSRTDAQVWALNWYIKEQSYHFKDEIDLFKDALQMLFDYSGKSYFIRGLRFFLDRALSRVGTGHMILLIFQS